MSWCVELRRTPPLIHLKKNPKVAIDCFCSESSSAGDVSKDVSSKEEVEQQGTDCEGRCTEQEERTAPMVR